MLKQLRTLWTAIEDSIDEFAVLQDVAGGVDHYTKHKLVIFFQKVQDLSPHQMTVQGL